MKSIPKVLKRRRTIVRLLETAQTQGAMDHYLALYARMVVGYDPSHETGSPRRG